MTINIGTPPAEHEIDEELVRRILRDQHPELADASIALLDAGWDNAMYRVGETDVVRLPRREVAASLMENEQAWLPQLAQSLPLPVPLPKRVGQPTTYYPWPWSIVPWLPGQPADIEPAAADQAVPLARFLVALHQPAPPNAPTNVFRGVPLCQRAQAMEERLSRLRKRSKLVTPDLLRIWDQALSASEATESRWLHGDFHARNVIVDNGAISGVIDWGDVTAGDVATDLASVWSLFDEPRARVECLAEYGASPTQLTRAKGWAALLGVALLETGLVDHPRHAAMGEAILRRLYEDV